MGIEALPSSTVRAIGSTQVLNDPASVIKELIDNALDAKSTSISVEIHSNTLDIIQVRDNGHGIPPEDRQLVARPHCTSKICDESELNSIGGRSLGFRGEALASAAEMSGSLTISTRVESEEVASSLIMNQQGEVVSQSRTSLPVGTTVKVTDFIKAHPVRKQVALKGADKTIAKVKHTLKAYAFARPNVRFSLRVLKAKNDKGNWTYAPKADGNAEDAAYKIVGAHCASHCTWSVMEEEGFMIQAFLPMAEAEVSRYSNVGAFISIDGRPVSTARRVPKQLMKIFREALQSANPRAEGVKEPFLFLAIQCRLASYDANIEPAKDDVLFEDAGMLISLIRQLFSAVYPSHDAVVADHGIDQIRDATSQMSEPQMDDDGFVTSLEQVACKKPAAEPRTPVPTNEAAPSVEDPGRLLPAFHSFRSNMYGRDEEDMEIMDKRPPSSHTEADWQDLRQAQHDVKLSNPWVMAKMNAVVRQQLPSIAGDGPSIDVNGVPQIQRNGQARRQHALPTPGPSSPAKGGRMPVDVVDATELRSESDQQLGSQYPPLPSPIVMAPRTAEAERIGETSDSPYRMPPAYNYIPSAQPQGPPSGTPLQMIPEPSTRRKRSPRKPAQWTPANAPFKPQVPDQSARDKVWFDHLENIDQPRASKQPHLPRRSNAGLVVQGELGDLVDDPRPLTPPRRNRDMRDFFTPRDGAKQHSIADMIETREYPQQTRTTSAGQQLNATRDGENEGSGHSSGAPGERGFMPASELAALEDAGHQKRTTSRSTNRRKTGERRALQEISSNIPNQCNDGVDVDAINVDDEQNAPKRRRTADGSPNEPRRTKSSRLPLERVLKGQGTQDLTLTIFKSMREISSIASRIDEERSLLAWNEAAVGACDAFAAEFEPTEVQDISVKLHTLLAGHFPGGEMTQDLGVIVQISLALHVERVIGEEAGMESETGTQMEEM